MALSEQALRALADFEPPPSIHRMTAFLAALGMVADLPVFAAARPEAAPGMAGLNALALAQGIGARAMIPEGPERLGLLLNRHHIGAGEIQAFTAWLQRWNARRIAMYGSRIPLEFVTARKFAAAGDEGEREEEGRRPPSENGPLTENVRHRAGRRMGETQADMPARASSRTFLSRESRREGQREGRPQGRREAERARRDLAPSGSARAPHPPERDDVTSPDAREHSFAAQKIPAAPPTRLFPEGARPLAAESGTPPDLAAPDGAFVRALTRRLLTADLLMGSFTLGMLQSQSTPGGVGFPGPLLSVAPDIPAAFAPPRPPAAMTTGGFLTMRQEMGEAPQAAEEWSSAPGPSRLLPALRGDDYGNHSEPFRPSSGLLGDTAPVHVPPAGSPQLPPTRDDGSPRDDHSLPRLTRPTRTAPASVYAALPDGMAALPIGALFSGTAAPASEAPPLSRSVQPPQGNSFQSTAFQSAPPLQITPPLQVTPRPALVALTAAGLLVGGLATRVPISPSPPLSSSTSGSFLPSLPPASPTADRAAPGATPTEAAPAAPLIGVRAEMGQITLIAPAMRVASPEAEAGGVAVAFDWASLAQGAGTLDAGGLARLKDALPAGAQFIYPALPAGDTGAGGVNLPLGLSLIQTILQQGYGRGDLAGQAGSAAAGRRAGRPTATALAARIVPGKRPAGAGAGQLLGKNPQSQQPQRGGPQGVLGEAGAGQAKRGGALDFLGIPTRLAPSLAGKPELAHALAVRGGSGAAAAPVTRPQAFTPLLSRVFPAFQSVSAEPDRAAWRLAAPSFGLRGDTPADLLAPDARVQMPHPSAALPQIAGPEGIRIQNALAQSIPALSVPSLSTPSLAPLSQSTPSPRAGRTSASPGPAAGYGPLGFRSELLRSAAPQIGAARPAWPPPGTAAGASRRASSFPFASPFPSGGPGDVKFNSDSPSDSGRIALPFHQSVPTPGFPTGGGWNSVAGSGAASHPASGPTPVYTPSPSSSAAAAPWGGARSDAAHGLAPARARLPLGGSSRDGSSQEWSRGMAPARTGRPLGSGNSFPPAHVAPPSWSPPATTPLFRTPGRAQTSRPLGPALGGTYTAPSFPTAYYPPTQTPVQSRATSPPSYAARSFAGPSFAASSFGGATAWSPASGLTPSLPTPGAAQPPTRLHSFFSDRAPRMVFPAAPPAVSAAPPGVTIQRSTLGASAPPAAKPSDAVPRRETGRAGANEAGATGEVQLLANEVWSLLKRRLSTEAERTGRW